MDIGDYDDKKAIDIKLEPFCKICNNLKILIKPEASGSASNKTDYLGHKDGSDDKKTIDIKLEPCCKICNNPKVPIKPKASGSTSNKPEYLSHQDGASDETNTKTDGIMQPDNQAQNGINGIKIKHEIDSNSDIVCQVKTFKREGEQILSDTKTLLNIDQTQIKVEVDNEIDLDYHMTNNVNVCDKENTALRKENVDYDNLNLEDAVNKQPVHQLQSKGM